MLKCSCILYSKEVIYIYIFKNVSVHLNVLFIAWNSNVKCTSPIRVLNAVIVGNHLISIPIFIGCSQNCFQNKDTSYAQSCLIFQKIWFIKKKCMKRLKNKAMVCIMEMTGTGTDSNGSRAIKRRSFEDWCISLYFVIWWKTHVNQIQLHYDIVWQEINTNEMWQETWQRNLR